MASSFALSSLQRHSKDNDCNSAQVIEGGIAGAWGIGGADF